MIGCLYEDRARCYTGLKLAVLSLSRHTPQLPLIVTCPKASEDLKHWMKRFPQVELRDSSDLGTDGFNVKPTLLSNLLSEGHSSVVWIDADLVATAPLPRILEHAGPATCVVAEEPYRPSRRGVDRARLWGLPPGREVPTLNTAVVRVTQHHVDLLHRWREMLALPMYLEAQQQPWNLRPPHLLGDQEALEALLASAEFSHIPLVVLRRGREIAHCHGPAGYGPLDRLRSVVRRSGPPPLVHAQGPKPWIENRAADADMSRKARLKHYYALLHHELSPYTAIAADYRADLDESLEWMEPRTRAGRLLKGLTGGNPVAQELPLAILNTPGRVMVGELRSFVERRRLR